MPQVLEDGKEACAWLVGMCLIPPAVLVRFCANEVPVPNRSERGRDG